MSTERKDKIIEEVARKYGLIGRRAQGVFTEDLFSLKQYLR